MKLRIESRVALCDYIYTHTPIPVIIHTTYSSSKSIEESTELIRSVHPTGWGVKIYIDRSRMVAPSSELRTLFASFDRDADGRISATELRLCMKATLGEDVPAEEAEAIVASADADGDGLLCEAEFVKLAQQGAGVQDEEEGCSGALREAFGMYEMEGEGCITPTSLKRMLGRLGSEQGVDDCHAMICRFDLDGDGVLSFQEFKIMMSA